MNKIASKIEKWLTGMQMFSFGEQSPPNPILQPPPTMSSALDHDGSSALRFQLSPLTTFGQFVALEIPEIFWKPRIEK